MRLFLPWGPIKELSLTTLTANGSTPKPQLILPQPHKNLPCGKRCCSPPKLPGYLPWARKTLFSFMSTHDSFGETAEVTIFPPLRCWESLLPNSGFQCAGNGGTLARAPVLQKVLPEKSVPTNVLEVPEHQTPNPFHKQTVLNDALTMSVQLLPCFNLKSTKLAEKGPLPPSSLHS